METIGIVAEYNPLHSGHRYQIQESRRTFGRDCPVIAVMSGNWVQRGEAAITDKWRRAAMALSGGADLVLELPTPWAISSAEGFATGAVSILNSAGVVTRLVFGSELGEVAPLKQVSDFLLSPDYPPLLARYLEDGVSFAAARQSAVKDALGELSGVLEGPNNNLGVEYLSALTRLGSNILPHTIKRQGVLHDSKDRGPDYASASYLRERLLSGDCESLLPYLRPEDLKMLAEGGLYSLEFGHRGVFARLYALTAEDFRALPDCGEGLEHRLLSALSESRSLDELYARAKSRRYAHARIRRLVLWAFLGLSAGDRPAAPPYLRVLGMTQMGQKLLKEMKEKATAPILTKAAHVKDLSQDAQGLFQLEDRATRLYSLCRREEGAPPLSEFTMGPVIQK